MKHTRTAVTLCVLILCGCSYTKTDVRGVTEPTAPLKRVIVLPFDDGRAPAVVRDKAALGSTGEPEVGAYISDTLAEALMRQDVYEVLHGRELAVESRRRGIHIDELFGLPPEKIAEHMDVDAVILGEVFASGQGWLFFASFGEVLFRARCVDAKTGSVLWEAEGRGTTLVNMERDPVPAACDRIAERLARGELDPGPLPRPLEERLVKRHELLGDLYVPDVPEADRAELPFRSRRRSRR